MTGLDVALKYENYHELEHNQELKTLFSKYEEIAINPALIPWSGVFCAFCEKEAGKGRNLDVDARSFLSYGRSRGDLKDAQRGDIVVLAPRKGERTQRSIRVCYFLEKGIYGSFVGLTGDFDGRVSRARFSGTRLLRVIKR